jgi:hypothetical protein
MPAPEDETPNEFVVTRSTVFHRSVFYGALIASVSTFVATIGLSLGKQILFSAFAGIIGLVASYIFVLAVVIFLFIPRVKHGSFWSVEVDTFMRSVIGTKWDRGG